MRWIALVIGFLTACSTVNVSLPMMDERGNAYPLATTEALESPPLICFPKGSDAPFERDVDALVSRASKVTIKFPRSLTLAAFVDERDEEGFLTALGRCRVAVGVLLAIGYGRGGNELSCVFYGVGLYPKLEQSQCVTVYEVK